MTRQMLEEQLAKTEEQLDLRGRKWKVSKTSRSRENLCFTYPIMRQAFERKYDRDRLDQLFKCNEEADQKRLKVYQHLRAQIIEQQEKEINNASPRQIRFPISHINKSFEKISFKEFFPDKETLKSTDCTPANRYPESVRITYS